MARTHVSDLTAALGEARREATSAPTRLRRLAEVSSAVGSLSRTAAGEAACRTLVELLGLDAAWVLEGSPVDMEVLARWARPGAAAARLGAQRLRVLADAAVDEVSQARDGRYVLVVVRLPDGPGHSLFVIGSARSGRLLSADDLACARLVAAAHAGQLQRPAPQPPPRARRTAGGRAAAGVPGAGRGAGRAPLRGRGGAGDGGRHQHAGGRLQPVLPDRAVRPRAGGRRPLGRGFQGTGGERRQAAPSSIWRGVPSPIAARAGSPTCGWNSDAAERLERRLTSRC